MRYHVAIGGRKLAVEVTPAGVVVDGEAIEAELVTVPGTRQRHLLLGGRSYALTAVRGDSPGAWSLQVAGRSHAVDVVEERARAIRGLAGPAGGPTGPRPGRAALPGRVRRGGGGVSSNSGIGQVEAD